MTVSRNRMAAWTSGVLLAFAATGAAMAGSTPLTTTRIAFGLSRPVYVTAPPGDYNRLFIVEQRAGSIGRIRLFDLTTNTLQATPYLSISPVSTASEQGLLGMAFHPDFLNNGYFWVNYTDSAGTTQIRRYRANAPFATSTTADASSGTIVLTIAQPQNNHNGGWLAFGPDGYLYIGTGDGGNANDTGTGHTSGTGNAQDITSNLLGKMLRIDVDGPDNIPGNADDDGFPADPNRLYAIPPDNPFVGLNGDDEIWAYGLRNPWRNSFDRETGDLWIADVGQDAVEEIDFQPVTSTGGENYGWRCMEGNTCTGLTGCTCVIGCVGSPLTCPIFTYTHAADGFSCSITGGYVYRGCAMPDMHGIYFFADYCSNRIKSFRYDGTTITEFTDRTTELDPPGTLSITTVSSFGEDARGELYICDLSGGEVFRIIPVTATPDCNSNGIPDQCESGPLTPQITTHPQSLTVCEGEGAGFSVVVAGTGNTYQWRRNGVNIPGAVNPAYNILVATAANAGNYDVVVTNNCGSTTSETATLTVNLGAEITDQPTNQTACAGSSATFTVVATGSPAPTYQWRRNSVNIAGATNASYTIPSASPGDAGSYDVIVTNICEETISNSVTLTINTGPSISQQPTGVEVCQTEMIQLSLTASGSPAPTYQWRRNGVNIPGATSSTYTVPSASAGDAGSYDCVVSNTCGGIASDAVTVTVEVRGDANCDGDVNNFDIDAFVFGLVDGPAAWSALYPCDFHCALDVNGDGNVDNFDIDVFVTCILSGGCL